MCMLRQRCSLSMLHRTCEYLHGVLGWVDEACPISCACLFILSPGLLRSTLSHTWCKLNLPIFLLRVGLLTLMYMDSLIVLAVSWSSLPIIWKLSCEVVWPEVQLWLCIGEGSFRCSLNLSPKVLEVFPIYSSSYARSPHWNQ